jgi:glutathione S-transferase
MIPACYNWTMTSDLPILVLGSKNYSSWSLRPWLFLRKVGFEFREHVIYFDAPDYQRQIAAQSPSQRVPVLIEGDLKIWDSLAICGYAAERQGQGWPSDPAARAVARSACAEMHAGFQALREAWPMNVRASGRRVPPSAAVTADIARIDAMWSQFRRRFGAESGWLFGAFSMADAMFAPVVFRFRTYGARLSLASQGYLEHALADPDMREWQEACRIEGHPLPDVDALGAP